MGIPLVAIATAVVALTMGSGEANPKDALAVIFALIGGFIFLLLFVQGRELNAAAAKETRAATEVGRPIDNPMTVPEPELWASLATGPIGPEALQARADGWDIARASQNSAWVICGLIFIFVPAAYLLEQPVLILIGAVPIAGFAVYRALKVVGGGGELDRGYESLGRSVEPLGLVVDERPTVGVQQRMPPTPGLKTDVRGALRLSGIRHGRPVSIVMEGGSNSVKVGVRAPVFAAKSSDGRIRAEKGAVPAEIESAMRLVPASVDWKNLTVSGGPEGIEVRRKNASGRDWLADLWLAERLADAAG